MSVFGEKTEISVRGVDFCDIYVPIYSSFGDTAETQMQIDENNEAFVTLCDSEIRNQRPEVRY